ncbi:FG-GAP-like repeat-containing protein [Tunturiibacter lichenicola]|uniref:FG-GAP-like repeat-containing protein n=1 Tax=Tunturiibacter lichenicola TaxID=2051959 RepID=UPI0021B472DE|nr:FG-GAP-like repeat-containing protein [Edaphobacter lichenicola]
MRLIRVVCLLATCVLPAIASTPQFSPRQDINTNFQHLTGLAVADFNGDGKLDFVVTDDVDKRVVVYLNTGNGTFAAPISTTLQISAIGVGSIVAGDFNEDGKQDLIVGTVAGLQAAILLTGNGDGTFAQQQALPSSYGFLGAAVADINHDSHLDVILGGNGSLYVYLGDGHGGFTLQPFANQPASDAFFGVVAGDFNNDKKDDFIATGFTGNSLLYFSGNGDGSFASPSTVKSSDIFSPQFLTSADFNGDGNRDLLVGSANIASVSLGNGDGTFQLNSSQVIVLATPPPISQIPATAPPVVGAADMDGDGKIDAVVADTSSASLSVFLNDGTGKFPQTAPDFTAALPAGSNQLQLADLNGDGLPDIIVTNYVTQNVSIFLSIRQPVKPTVTLTSSASQALVGTPITLAAQVSGVQGLGATGSVTLLDGTTSLGQQPLNSASQATFSISNLSTGQHSLSISYAGDSNYLASTSSVLAESVTDFQLSLASAFQTVSSGSTVGYSLSVTPVSSFAGNVTFTCSGLPAGASCNSATAALNGQPATVTVNVTTTAVATNEVHAKPHSHMGEESVLSLASLLVVGLLPFRRRGFPRLAVLLLVSAGLGLALGCSGGGSKGPSSNPPLPVTTPFTITGSTTLAGQTVSHQVSASITIN